MDKVKNLAKNGWHHKDSDGGRERWRDMKGINTAAGWIGKGKEEDHSASYSTPYVRKDPTLFPPPPKTKVYAPEEGPAARSIASSTSPTLPPHSQQLQEEDGLPKPIGPFRVNTTGIDTTKFPKPPLSSDRRPPPPTPPSGRVQNGPPSLPPRLPPRGRSTPSSPIQPAEDVPSAQSPSSGFLNQEALNRLGRAGIAVPGLGINSSTAPPPLPSRESGSLVQSSTTPISGTTWAEKQAALKTVASLKKNPQSVSLSEMRGAASVGRNFQQRHSEQVAAGIGAASQFSQNHGLAERFKPPQAVDSSSNTPPVPAASTLAGKKAPPPPPAKKKELQGGITSETPPPIPMTSKPR